MPQSIRLKYAGYKTQPGRNETLVFQSEHYGLLTDMISRVTKLNEKNPNATEESKDLIERSLKALSTYIKESFLLRRKRQPVYPPFKFEGDHGVSNISTWTHIPFEEMILCVVVSNILNAFKYGSMEDQMLYHIKEANKYLPVVEKLLK